MIPIEVQKTLATGLVLLIFGGGCLIAALFLLGKN